MNVCRQNGNKNNSIEKSQSPRGGRHCENGMALAHELKHAFDRNFGIDDYTLKSSNGILQMIEIDAQNVENLVRLRTGDPIHTERIGHAIPPQELWNPDDPNLVDKMYRR